MASTTTKVTQLLIFWYFFSLKILNMFITLNKQNRHNMAALQRDRPCMCSAGSNGMNPETVNFTINCKITFRKKYFNFTTKSY